MSEKIVNKQVQYLGIATPAGNPKAGRFFLYFKADGLLYKKDSTGTETVLTGSSPKITVTLTNQEVGAMVAGDVVVIDTANDSSCLLGSSNSDTKVAGVVAIGAASGQSVEVCTSGVIDTKVNGVISRGDSLGTSAAATGRARSAAGAVNAVVGKALKANGAGDGIIPVLVNLA